LPGIQTESHKYRSAV